MAWGVILGVEKDGYSTWKPLFLIDCNIKPATRQNLAVMEKWSCFLCVLKLVEGAECRQRPSWRRENILALRLMDAKHRKID